MRYLGNEISWKCLLQVIYMKMSCGYLRNVFSRQVNSKTILRYLEDNLGNHASHLKRLRKSFNFYYGVETAMSHLTFLMFAFVVSLLKLI